MITYNSPEHAKERQNVVPPTIEDIGATLDGLNFLHSKGSIPEKAIDILQRLIDHHANLQHLYDVVGGWEGLERLRNDETIYLTPKEYYANNNPLNNCVILHDGTCGKCENLTENVSALCDECAIKLMDFKSPIINSPYIPQPTGINPGGLESEWISVKDRLPEPIVKEYLVATKYGVEISEWYEGDYFESGGPDGYFKNTEGDDITHLVTYWQPLPEPPTE